MAHKVLLVSSAIVVPGVNITSSLAIRLMTNYYSANVPPLLNMYRQGAVALQGIGVSCLKTVERLETFPGLSGRGV